MADVLSVIADVLKQDKQQKREHNKMMKEVQKKLKEKDSEEVAEEEGDKEDYMKFFAGKLKKYGVKSPAELSDEDKKKFFNEIEKDWKHDSSEEVEVEEKEEDLGKRVKSRMEAEDEEEDEDEAPVGDQDEPETEPEEEDGDDDDEPSEEQIDKIADLVIQKLKDKADDEEDEEEAPEPTEAQSGKKEKIDTKPEMESWESSANPHARYKWLEALRQVNEHCGVCDEQGIEEVRDHKGEIPEPIKVVIQSFGKKLSDYAKKSGGMDRDLFLDIAKSAMEGKLPNPKYIWKQDTAAKDFVLDSMAKEFGSLSFRPAVAPVESVAKETIKKIGTKKITETGYIVVTNNPTKFKLAQKIFGKNKVFKSDVLSAQSTSSRAYEHITKESLKKIKDSSIKRTIASQADDAANGVSKFIIQSPTRVTRGESVVAPFNKFFGQNIKFTDKTLKNIKLAETGPTALGKEVVTTGVVKKTAEEVVKAPIRTGTQKVVKTPDVITIGGKTVKTRPSLKGSEVVKVKELPVERPWYVAIVPPWLRTSKSVTEVSKKVGGTEIPLNPYLRQTTEGLNIGRTIGTATGLSVGVPFAKRVLTPDKPEKRITTDLNIDQLFGGTTGPLERTELDVPQSIEIFDE